MTRLVQTIEKVSQSTFTVLILGESGTGKELVAQCIHECGPRKNRPFVPIDCAGLPPSLVESELFGHAKGAFTGAVHGKIGLLQAAGHGTVFFDEIAELPVEVQPKLLRTLQEKEARALGSTRVEKLGARVVAATNRDLAALIQAGKFRQDLYFRLNVVAIDVPPLRQRKSDIPLLVEHFINTVAPDEALRVSDESLSRVMKHDWPGNVRELEHCVQRAVAMRSSEVLDLESVIQTTQEFDPATDLVPTLRQAEAEAIRRAMAKANGNKRLAASLLDIGKTTLYRKLKEFGLVLP